jgi:hypothetical protein
VTHGCGAHSEAVVGRAHTWTIAPTEEHSPASVTDAMPTEPLGHS